MNKKAYKYRIYPNKATAEKLQWTLDRCRELYNAALSERRDAWKYAGKTISCFDQINDLPAIKHEIRAEYEDINSMVLCDVLRRLDKAYQNFFSSSEEWRKSRVPTISRQRSLRLIYLPGGLWLETHGRA